MRECGVGGEGWAPSPRGSDAASATTAYQLLAGEGDRSGERPRGTDLPEELLADLYALSLIITPDYVGRDRRTRSVRHHPDRRGASGRRDPGDPGDAKASSPGPSLRWVEVLVIVVSTVRRRRPAHPDGHRMPPAAGTSNHSPTATPATSTPGARALAVQRPAGSTPGQQARAATRARSARRARPAGRPPSEGGRRAHSTLVVPAASVPARRAAVARRQALAKQERARVRARSRAEARARAAARAGARARRHNGRA